MVLIVPQIVVLDTNILTVPAQFGVDIFEEARRELELSIEFVVLDAVIGEIERKLETGSRIEKQKFKIALDLAKRCTIERGGNLIKSATVDQQILEFAQISNGVIATNDKSLIEQAIAQGTPVLFLRGKKRLQLRGTIS